MKYYETSFEEYIQSRDHFNAQPECEKIVSTLSKNVKNMPHMILYGPSGSGKYTQSLSIIQKYSPSKLKYDKKIYLFNDKSEQKKNTMPSFGGVDKKKANISISRNIDFVYRISDIHYEIDMMLLGCNAKTLWNDLYFQIIDIISVTSNKEGIILCKNMHMIHSELLDIFHSYINEPLQESNICVKFILLTESVSFLPRNIQDVFQVVALPRVKKDSCHKLIQSSNSSVEEVNTLKNNLQFCGEGAIENLKELHLLKKVKPNDIPINVFNVIVDQIIKYIIDPSTVTIPELRNSLYDMLTYNLDVSECFMHIVFHLLEHEYVSEKSSHEIMIHLYKFFKYFNNNYRPIYHLECMIVEIMNKISYENER
jgi:DNA polymerase III delta prime subunit